MWKSYRNRKEASNGTHGTRRPNLFESYRYGNKTERTRPDCPGTNGKLERFFPSTEREISCHDGLPEYTPYYEY